VINVISKQYEYQREINSNLIKSTSDIIKLYQEGKTAKYKIEHIDGNPFQSMTIVSNYN